VRTAARALVEIAQQDFGQSRKKWLLWWEAHRKTERAQWLLEGLSQPLARDPLRVVRGAAPHHGEYFGYHFDLPKREREEARERWQAWWYASGNGGPPDRR